MQIKIVLGFTKVTATAKVKQGNQGYAVNTLVQSLKSKGTHGIYLSTGSAISREF
jgi:hypothetical protein